MSTSPFMDDYSSEDYSDHDDVYYFVPTATSPPQVWAQVEIQTQSNELQNLIIDQQEHVSESVYFDVLPELEAEAAEEGGEMGQSIYLAVESYFDLEAQAAIGVATAALEAETVVEELAVESYLYLEAQVKTALPAALETETGLEEGDVIESGSLETVEADTEVEAVESMIEEIIYEAVESESDLEAEGSIEEPNSETEHEADADAPEAETEVEGDVIGESIYEAVGSDYDLEAEAEDVVEEEDEVVEEVEDRVEEVEMVEGEDTVEEENGMVEEEDDIVEEEHDATDEGDTIDEPQESDKNLQAQAEALVEEGASMEESIHEPLISNFDIQAEGPEAPAELAVSIEMTTFEAQEPDSDLEPEEPEGLIDEQLDSCDEESDRSEEEWDSDADDCDMDPEDSDMDSSDSDPNEEEEDDVVVSYFKSSTTIRSKAWNIWVPASALAWAKLPVTDTTTLENSSLQESFLGCRPMLILQECGNAVMNAIETLMCELLRIRNGLRRVLGALFRKWDTTKHT